MMNDDMPVSVQLLHATWSAFDLAPHSQFILVLSEAHESHDFFKIEAWPTPILPRLTEPTSDA